MGIGSFRVDVGAIAGGFGGNGGKHRSELDAVDLCGFGGIEAILKSHVEVPFVTNFEGPDAAADGVFGEGFEAGIPDGVAGPLMFVVSANPAFEFGATAVFGHFNAEVHAAESDTAGDKFFEQLQAIFLDGRVSGTTIGEDDHCGSIIEGGFVADPAHFVSFDFEICDVLESFFEEDCAGTELVHQWRVAGFSGNEDQFFRCVAAAGGLQSDGSGSE